MSSMESTIPMIDYLTITNRYDVKNDVKNEDMESNKSHDPDFIHYRSINVTDCEERIHLNKFFEKQCYLERNADLKKHVFFDRDSGVIYKTDFSRKISENSKECDENGHYSAF